MSTKNTTPPLELTGEGAEAVGFLADWVSDGHVCDADDGSPCTTCEQVRRARAAAARIATATATTVRECNYWRPIPPGGIALPCNCGMGCDGPTAAATATSREDAALARIGALLVMGAVDDGRAPRDEKGELLSPAILARARALALDADARGTAHPRPVHPHPEGQSA